MSFLMNLGYAAGGAARGISQGIQDYDRYQDLQEKMGERERKKKFLGDMEGISAEDKAGLQVRDVPVPGYNIDDGPVPMTKGLFAGDKMLGMGDERALEAARAEETAKWRQGLDDRRLAAMTAYDPVQGMNQRRLMAADARQAELHPLQKTHYALGNEKAKADLDWASHERDRTLLNEGFEDALRGVYSGGDPREIEAAFGKVGKLRVDEGTLQYTPVKDRRGNVVDYTITGTRNGNPFSTSARQMEDQLLSAKDRVAKREEMRWHDMQADFARNLYSGGKNGAGGKGPPLGMTDDGQFITSDGSGGFTTKPVMINGKPATPEQLKMFKKMYNVGTHTEEDPELSRLMQQRQFIGGLKGSDLGNLTHESVGADGKPTTLTGLQAMNAQMVDLDNRIASRRLALQGQSEFRGADKFGQVSMIADALAKGATPGALKQMGANDEQIKMAREVLGMRRGKKVTLSGDSRASGLAAPSDETQYYMGP